MRRTIKVVVGRGFAVGVTGVAVVAAEPLGT